MSIPLLFAATASAHHHISHVLVGKRVDWAWHTLFAVLGLASLIDVTAANWLKKLRRGNANAWPPDPEILRRAGTYAKKIAIARTLLAHLSLRCALFVFVRYCIQVDILEWLTRAPD